MLVQNDNYKRIVLNHANLQKPVTVVLGTLAFFHHSDTTQSTHVYTTAGVLPVVETEKQIESLIDKALNKEK